MLRVTRPPDDPIRVWSAGCASGEEAYTLAMLLAEALGEEAFRRRVKIYATDVDEDALYHARATAVYPRERARGAAAEACASEVLRTASDRLHVSHATCGDR